jgi:hypothetical protein
MSVLPLLQSSGGSSAPPSWGTITSGLNNLTLNNAGFTTTFNQTSAVPWLWANTTVASSTTTNASPLLELAANYWTGAASAIDTWTMGSSLAAGTNGASTLTIAHSGSTGKAAVSLGTTSTLSLGNLVVGATATPSTISTSGNHLTFTGSSGWYFSTGTSSANFNITAQTGFPINFVADSSLIAMGANSGSLNTGITATAAGTIAIGNGTAGDGSGSLKFTGYVSPFSVALTGQANTITATNLVATPVTTALYEVNYYLNDTTAGTSGTVSVTIAWNDGAAQSFTSANVTFGTLGAYVSGRIMVKATSGAITYATTVTSAVGSPAYSLDIRVVQLN